MIQQPYYPTIRVANTFDVNAILDIAGQYKQELGYINPAALREHVANGTVHVADYQGFVIGFVDYHTRKDGWSTVYHIATLPAYQGKSVGRYLLYSVPPPIRLKVTEDNESAIRFYKNAGMRWIDVEVGKTRGLLVFTLPYIPIIVMGGKDWIPIVARKSGLAYGARNIDRPMAWPFMLDIYWKRYVWEEYVEMVRRFQPVMAVSPDYTDPAHRDLMWNQVDTLFRVGVMKVLVVPKFPGAVADIPQRCIVAVSVPTDYAGFLPEAEELVGRQVHLLGGSPEKQMATASYYSKRGAKIVSMDGNSIHKAGLRRKIWTGIRWMHTPENTLPKVMIASARNWVYDMHELHAELQQEKDDE